MTNNEGQALSASVSVGRSFLALLIVALLVMLSFVGAYVLNFHHEGLSSSKEVWALFGEYVGGTVGPLLGFFTLLGVVLTVALQAQQLQDSRKQLQTASVELENSRKLQLDTVKALTEQAAHADIAAKALIQQAGYADQSAKAMTQQAVYGSLAARIAALNAAMSVAMPLS